MTTVPAPALPTEKELRRLLALRDPDDAVTLLALLENPPPDAPEAIVSRLAHIAKEAQNSQARLADTLAKSITIVVGILVVSFVAVLKRNEAPYTIVIFGIGCMLSMLVSAVVHGPEQGRIANHAALLLARANDERAVRYLANLWTPHPLSTKDAAFNADVSRELTRLLVERPGKRLDRATEKALRSLVERVFSKGRLAKVVSRLRPARDLTESDMDLLLAVVRHVSQPYARRAPNTTEPLADNRTLQKIASLSTSGTNYNLLRDTTQVLLKQRGSKSA